MPVDRIRTAAPVVLALLLVMGAASASRARPFLRQGERAFPGHLGRSTVGPHERASDGTSHRAGRPGSFHLLVRIPRPMTVRAFPHHDARRVGTLVSSSRFYHVPLTAWVEATRRQGRWGRVDIPYTWPRRDGWIPLVGLRRSHTFVEVRVDLSRHWVAVLKFGTVKHGFRAATGAAGSPTPPGRYFVTDRVPFAPGSALGSFAFGISGIQPRLPVGWSGGDQLALHGTNDPSSIGTSASAGCVRLTERALAILKPWLQLGTPVVIQR